MAHQFFFNPYILDNLPAPNTGFDVVQDLSEPRLRMYITSRGVKTFFVRKRVGGRDKRIIIGNYPDIDIEDARGRVAEILRTAAQKPKIRRNKIEFKKLVDLYMVRRVRRVDMAREKLVRAINRHLVQLFPRIVTDITSDDIANVLGQISGPAISGRMHELLQSIFKFAIEEGYLKTNPVTPVPKVAQNRRTRPLTRAGLHRLVAA
ncbi:MAG: Arm DNA-binding domain-containing protein, partial [Alphaproteobacteria bacterium]|nr:Arm DNA-binding domain-containing protein [Alphaproteobacteria bacterium]